ncbi:hypothetical protein [Phaeodactylibacter xiamenensis]|jgi:hypothetical protein|uniref:hypothetical protein n=1 Tax=Phaeodactylibacter xiamenensis TaxID=1524460 RepID=UPI003BA87032
MRNDRTGKYTAKYRVVLKPVVYTKRFAYCNKDDESYRKGPLLPFYVNNRNKVRRFPYPKNAKISSENGEVPAVYAEVYLNYYAGYGKWNELPIAIYTAKSGWNNDVSSFKKIRGDEDAHLEARKEELQKLQEA